MNPSEYVFELLRTDEELALHRGRPRRPSAPSHRPILLLRAVGECPAPATLKRLQHEYSLARELRSEWAARPVALTEHQGRAALILEDPGGEPLDGLVEPPMELGLFLRLAVGLASSLSELHARGIIHKDVKPANALVDTATGRTWLMGFGIASRQGRERQAPEPPEVIAGSLPYMSPEQTGRMNRSIDSRSDLYAAGVTLYEMSTGTLPFAASDPMEWVHSHIARRPVPPAERRKEVPGPVSAIIVKLLAKTPEDRYQTAVGLERDLRRCLAAWDRVGQVGDFRLGEDDTPDRLRVPEKLYGRSREVDALLAAVDRMATSERPEVVLVSGYSGVGKSSVVNELHKALVPHRGLFAWGKCERSRRDGPFTALAQALQRLIQALLRKSEAELGQFRDLLREALETNGRLMVDLVPKLELVIGEQPKVAELPAQDAQRRFQFVFRRFIGVFARPEHPLALFLDDMQWLDAATLDLLEDVFTRSDLRHLMLIGAYRDNEVTPAHPMMMRLQAMRDAGTLIHEIKLAPLARQDVAELVADALRCEPPRAAPLAELIYDKTAGNPFFLIHFIQALLGEGLLAFDHRAGRWSWDLERIHAKGYTSNVADLMVGKLTRLPVRTQEALQQLGCLGNSAASATLALVCGTSEEQVHANLGEAVRLELIERLDDLYRFMHDRVQEAAYALIPEPSRASEHLRIGRLLAAHTPTDEREEVIFEIVNQLNRGVALITSPDEREQLAELNLIAGKRARVSNAYTSALAYLVVGSGLLDDSSDRRELIFPIEFHRAECEFLTGEWAAAEQRLTTLASQAADMVELATVACLRMALYWGRAQSASAVAVCLDYLRRLGHECSPRPTEDEVRREYDRIRSRVGDRAIEDLLELPLMSDPVSLATLDVLTKAIIPAWFTDTQLGSWIVCRAVNLSLEGGNSDGSCIAYEHLGMIAGPLFGDYKVGSEFGRLGYELVEQRGLRRFQPRTYMFFGSVILPWTAHVRAGRDLVRRAFDAACRMGDLSCAVGSGQYLITNLLTAGEPLAEVEREAANAFEFATKARFGLIADHLATQLGLIRTLRGSTSEFGCFDDDRFDEARFEQKLASNPVFKVNEFWYWTRKTQARFLAGDYRSAVDAASRAHRLAGMSPSFLETAESHFYGALSHAASSDSASPGEKRQHLEALATHHRQLEIWAELCPENFDDRAALVGAEVARIDGRDAEAMRLYERAISAARENAFIHHEALASELTARFYSSRGIETVAQVYLREARNGYLRWGADGKVRQLDRLHPHLCADQPPPDARRTIGAPLEHLDLATVLKVAQAVSGEIVLEQLIDTLLRTAIEHAGAERGLLVLVRSGELWIEAEAKTDGHRVAVKLRGAPVAGSELAESVVHYAARTQESVILDDGSDRGPFHDDPYIRARRARSVFCLPLVKQDRLVALLYLENSLAPNVFTPARTAVLRVLASQAAMALENSRLYGELQEREAKIRRLIDANVVGVVISDLDGRLSEANRAYLDIVGCTREDLVSGRLNWTDLTPPEWMAASRRSVEQLRATGTSDLFEKEYLLKDGTRVPVLIAAALITPIQAVAFVVDLRERKAAEEALVRAREELARVTRVSTVGELTASIAHEINQPLAAVTTYAGAALLWLLHDPPNLERAREALQYTIREGEHAGAIVSRVRALVQKAPPRTEAVDIDKVILEVLDLSRNKLQRNGVSIRTQLAAGKQLVRGDRIQLQQVVLNLILNAVDAMSEPETSPRKLTIASRRDEANQVLVEVRDSGRGFQGETVERIFEPFFTTKIDGMGMGLSISRSIVVAHGGRLWAMANEPRGAIFRFALPAVEPETHPAA
jgi:PAS domain S-box-containing protein